MKHAQILCIYCKQWCPPPKKLGEHIILDGLGGRATIRDVCSPCNSLLGRTLDEELLRKSLIAYRRFMHPEITSGEIGAVQFLETNVGFLDGRLRNSGEFVMAPQALFLDDGFHGISSKKDDEVLRLAVLDAKERGSNALHIDVRDVPEHSPPRLIASLKKNRTHLLRARTQSEVETVLRVLQGGAFHEPRQYTLTPIGLDIRLSMDPNIPGRCAAKMAFNAAAYVFGSQAMVSGEYDPIRNYILGRDVREGPFTFPDGEVGLRIDHRYVEDMHEGEDSFIQGDSRHYDLKLGSKDGHLCAVVSLLGGAERFWVRLGPIPEGQAFKLPIGLIRQDPGDFWFLFGRGGWFHGNEPQWPEQATPTEMDPA